MNDSGRIVCRHEYKFQQDSISVIADHKQALLTRVLEFDQANCVVDGVKNLCIRDPMFSGGWQEVQTSRLPLQHRPSSSPLRLWISQCEEVLHTYSFCIPKGVRWKSYIR